MKRKSASQFAFFNLRVLIGLCIIFVAAFVALASLGVFSATAGNIVQALGKHKIITQSDNPLVPIGFDCATIHQKGIDKQENFRAGAIMMACGESPNVGTTATSTLGPVGRFIEKILRPIAPSPQAYGAADVDVVTGTETSPHVIQSESYTAANPDNPNQVVVAYNDSRCAASSNFSALSVSTDGGTTFTRVTNGSGCSPFAGTSGDPVALYNKPSGTWFTIWIDGACGGGGMGGYKSSTPDNPNGWTHFCAHSGSGDDRESGWADNNPSSPFYGRMYMSWNDFNIGSGALEVTYSSDNGATWHSPIVVSNTATFIRDTQITGDLSGNGTIYIAGMDEGGGGFPHNDINKMYKSTDGGNTWTNTYTGPAFPGPGVTASGYFACMFNDSGAFWRHEGWGEPAAFNNVVSLVYSQHGTGADAGDVYYIRSSDGGVTFGAPFKLNSDSTTRPQWQANISVSPSGTLLATWYDGREFASCLKGNAATPCYRMWSRKSNDNGLTWQPDMALSDASSPEPGQSDGNIQPTYAGDYDYGSAITLKHTTSWTDGRVAIGGASQQDVFTDRELVGFAVTTSVPACDSLVNTQLTDFDINLSDAVDPATVQASDFTVNGIPANSFTLMNGNTLIRFHFNSSPVVLGSNAMHIAAGAFLRISDGMPNFEFSCSFCYAATALQITSTNPPVGGTFTPPAPGNYTFDVNFNQAVDPASVQTTDLMVSGNSGPSVTAVSLINGNMTVRFTLHMNFGGTLDASIGAGSITANGCNANAAFSGTYNVAGCPPQDHYTISQIGGSIVPGTTDIGNHIDDGVTTVALPFAYTLYGQVYNAVNLSSNGNAQFTTTDSAFSNVCLPWASHNYAIFPYWDDLRTDTAGSGIFTSVSGSAPNRIFNIEWRATYFSGGGSTNHELRLYEGQARFDVIYGTVSQGNASATAGVQKDTVFDQYFCNGSGAAATGGQSYILQSCEATTVLGAVSRKTHTGAGDFDINLPLTGTPGIECRKNSATNDYTMVVTFAGNVAVTGSPQAQVTSGTGCVGSGGTCMGGNNVTVSGAIVTIPLTNIADDQTIMVQLNGVNAAADQPAVNVVIPMTIIVADTNGSGNVSSADIAQTKGRIGQAVTSANFRSDVNASGGINSTDVTIIKQNLP